MTDNYREQLEEMISNSVGVSDSNKLMARMFGDLIELCGGQQGVGPTQALAALTFLSPFVAPFFANFPKDVRRDIARTWLRMTLKKSDDFIALTEAMRRPPQ